MYTISNVELSRYTLEHVLMNAAGTCKTLEHVKKLARSVVAAIVVGSGTLNSLPGNSGNVFYDGKIFTLNSLGLPNLGADYYRKVLPEMVAIAHAAGKLLIFSIAGFSPEEYAQLAELAWEAGVDIVEVNLGCPNVWNDGTQKRIASLVPGLIDLILTAVKKVALRFNGVFSVKLSPMDPYRIEDAVNVLNAHEVEIVVATNTNPNCFALENGIPVITPGGGLAGMAGPALKPFSLGNVRQLRAQLHPRTKIIAAGGIGGGQDVIDYLTAEAVAVQVASHYFLHGENPEVFSHILSELVALCPE